MTTPDFSPATLKAFLHARVGHAMASGEAQTRASAWRALRAELRRRINRKLSAATFDLAYAGTLQLAAHRAVIWGALGHVPADHGVLLLDMGGQDPNASFGVSHAGAVSAPKGATAGRPLDWSQAAQTALDVARTAETAGA